MAGHEGRASAALVCVEGQPAVLTISANGELFYTRRFELPEASLAGSPESTKSLAPLSEYMTDFSGESASPKSSTDTADDDQAKRFLVEFQRSLDLWDRTWVDLPLSSIRTYAGKRSEELSGWLTERLEQVVSPMDVNALFAGFEGGAAGARARCLPLLGVLKRVESRKL
jgi:MSHA biogenesis protein MshI